MDLTLSPNKNIENKFIETCSILNECSIEQSVLNLNNDLYFKDFVTGIFTQPTLGHKPRKPYNHISFSDIMTNFLYRLSISVTVTEDDIEKAHEDERRLQHTILPLAPYGYRYTNEFVKKVDNCYVIFKFCKEYEIADYCLNLTKYPEIGTYVDSLSKNTDIPFDLKLVRNKIIKLSYDKVNKQPNRHVIAAMSSIGKDSRYI